MPRHDKPVLLGKTDSSNVDMVFSKLKKCKKIISISTIENAIVITTNGSIIQCLGPLNGVYPEVDLGEKSIGAWVTHNHPIGSAGIWRIIAQGMKKCIMTFPAILECDVLKIFSYNS